MKKKKMLIKLLKDRKGKKDERYVIAEDGSYIRNKNTGKKLDNIYIHQGYRVITIVLNGNYYHGIKICHLQWLAWKGIIPKEHSIHHKDEDKLNDHKNNHDCLTNSKHMGIHKKGKKHPMFGRTGENSPLYRKPRSEETKKKISISLTGNHSGEKHPMAILTKNKVKKIRKLSYINKVSQKDLAAKFKVSKSCINNVVQGYHWNPENLTKEELKLSQKQ